jgi:hypothetical protein
MRRRSLCVFIIVVLVLVLALTVMAGCGKSKKAELDAASEGQEPPADMKANMAPDDGGGGPAGCPADPG